MRCLIEKTQLEPFQIFPRKALINKPLRHPIPDAVADMAIAYNPVVRHISSELRSSQDLDQLHARVYREAYESFAPTRLSASQTKYTDFVAAWIDSAIPAFSRVLEVGCHDGYLLGKLKSRGHKCVGVEPSPFAEVAKTDFGLEIHADFFQEGMFPPGSFDVIIVRHVVEHVPDPVAFLTTCAKTLRENGLAYIEVPNSRWSLEESFFPEFHADHISYFSLPSLRALLFKSGLSEILHADAASSYMRFPFLNALARKGPRSANRTDTGTWFQDFSTQAAIDRFRANWNRYLGNLDVVLAGEKVAVWGTGSIGTQLAIDAGWGSESATFVDPNKANQGKRLSVTGNLVHGPEILTDLVPTVLVLASGWEHDVRQQSAPYLSAKTKVIGFSDLLRA